MMGDAGQACRDHRQTWVQEGLDVFQYNHGQAQQYADQIQDLCFTVDVPLLRDAVSIRPQTMLWAQRQRMVTACEAIQRQQNDQGCS